MRSMSGTRGVNRKSCAASYYTVLKVTFTLISALTLLPEACCTKDKRNGMTQGPQLLPVFSCRP